MKTRRVIPTFATYPPCEHDWQLWENTVGLLGKYNRICVRCNLVGWEA